MKLKRLKQMQTSRNRTRATKVSILLLKRVKTQPMLIVRFLFLQSQTIWSHVTSTYEDSVEDSAKASSEDY